MYTPRETFLFHLLEAGSGAWRSICVVDENVAEVPAQTMRVLPRMAAVVDITGLSPGQAADRIRAQQPCGILALDDGRLDATAMLASELGLRFHTPGTVELLNNKVAQRRALARAGLETPRFSAVAPSATRADRMAAANEVRLPAIVKPQVGVSSRNTARATTQEALVRLIDELLPKETSGLIIEELIPDSWPRADRPFADYVSVESVVAQGIAFHIMITGRFPLSEPFLETGTYMPADLTAGERTAVLNCATAAINALGIQVGGVHTEIKLSPDGPRVIEVNGRLGGGHIPQLVEQVTGVSLLKLAGLSALGLPLGLPREIEHVQAAYMLLYQAPVGAHSVRDVRGATETAKLPGVRGVFLNKAVGERVDWREGTDGFVWMVEGNAPDITSIPGIVSNIKDTLRVEFDYVRS
jgi:biotin carboxylase